MNPVISEYGAYVASVTRAFVFYTSDKVVYYLLFNFLVDDIKGERQRVRGLRADHLTLPVRFTESRVDGLPRFTIDIGLVKELFSLAVQSIEPSRVIRPVQEGSHAMHPIQIVDKIGFPK